MKRCYAILLCAIFIFTCTAHTSNNIQPKQNIVHLRATVGAELDHILAVVNGISNSLNTCCTSLASKIDSIQTFTCVCTTTNNMCIPTSIAQSDVDSGTIFLNSPGNYCLAQDITADIIICDSNVTLNLNGFTLLGTIDIQNNVAHIKIYNGTIQATAPLDTADASQAAVTLNDGVWDIQIRNCSIICDYSIISDLNGRSAINNAGNYTIIDNCYVAAGAASFSTIAGSAGSLGGTGIITTGAYAHINACTIVSGNGSQAANSLGTSGADGGNGGIGIYNSGQSTSISLCVITTGDGGAASGTDTDNGGVGGSGGAGIYTTGDNAQAIECTISTGNGNTGGSTSAFFVTNGTGGNGGTGIVNCGFNNQTVQCTITTGKGGDGGNVAGVGNGNGGTGGTGGKGIVNSGSNAQNISSTIITGDGGQAGFGYPGGNGGSGGNGINCIGQNALISQCIITTGNGNSGAHTGAAVPSGNGGNGGLGINNASYNCTLQNCRITTGNGGQAGDFGFPGGTGGDGGDGIATTNLALVTECIITTGDGGIGGISNGNIDQSGGPGGNGGIGIHQRSGNQGTIKNCTILKTGNGALGGAGGGSGPIGPTGNGGDGILISNDADAIEVGICTIGNTGSGLNGGSALNDMTTTTTVVIYGNFAYNIAGTQSYILSSGAAIDSPTGTPFIYGGSNSLQNIHKP